MTRDPGSDTDSTVTVELDWDTIRDRSATAAPAEGRVGAGLCHRLTSTAATTISAPITATQVWGPVLEQDILSGNSVA